MVTLNSSKIKISKIVNYNNHFDFLMVMYIQDVGKIIKNMEEVNYFYHLVHILKDILKMVKCI